MTTTTLRSATAVEAIKKWQEACNRHDANAMAVLHAPDAVIYQSGMPTLRGREAIRQDFEEMLKAFPDFHITIFEPIAKDDYVAVEGLITGTQKWPISGPKGIIPATNRQIELRVARFCRLDAIGQFVEVRRYIDTADLIRQLGVEV